jgi:hypothetical protein
LHRGLVKQKNVDGLVVSRQKFADEQTNSGQQTIPRLI